MSLQEWSAIAQILAACVGIPSLIFVGVQISLAAKAVRASSSQAHSATYHELSASIVRDDNGFTRIWHEGLGGTGELLDEDRVRFFAFVSSLLRFFESARIQWRRKQLYREHWRAIDQQARYLATQPGVIEFWNERQHWHCAEFQSWFNSLARHSQEPTGQSDTLDRTSSFSRSCATVCLSLGAPESRRTALGQSWTTHRERKGERPSCRLEEPTRS